MAFPEEEFYFFSIINKLCYNLIFLDSNMLKK